MDSLRTEHPEALAAVSERAVLFETTAVVPFGVFVTDDTPRRMAIELRDGPLVTGLVTNDTPDALGWAETTFERFRAQADRIVLDRENDPGED